VVVRLLRLDVADSDYDNLWKAIFISCDLFRALAQTVAHQFGYTYNIADDSNMMEYLGRMKNEG
jgi:aminoglycoside 6-adenylyltransferase